MCLSETFAVSFTVDDSDSLCQRYVGFELHDFNKNEKRKKSFFGDVSLLFVYLLI